MVADGIPRVLMIGNRPGGLDYELSDTSQVTPMPFPPGSPKQS